jgi:hypothetical protein
MWTSPVFISVAGARSRIILVEPKPQRDAALIAPAPKQMFDKGGL